MIGQKGIGSTFGRLVFGRFACGVSLALALLMLAPALTRNVWIARLAASELSAGTGLIALAGLLALRRNEAKRGFKIAGAVALLLSVLPFAATLPAFAAHHRTFSMREYVMWGPSHAAIERQTDLSLEPSQPTLLLDLYRGLGAGPRPLLVIVHGGSFSGGDKGENKTVSEIFAARGYSVADVQYRLSPTFRFPRAVQDVKCLAGRLRERAQQFGIDPDRVAYLGRSAGGAIAIVAAYSAGDPRLPPSCDVPDRPLSAIVTLYAPLDLEWGWRIRAFPDPIVGYRVLERYIGGTPSTEAEAFRSASATAWVSALTPPTLLIHGTRDSLVSPHHTQLLIDTFLRKGLTPPRRLLVPFADHGFDYHPGGLGEQLARAEILEFLGETLKR